MAKRIALVIVAVVLLTIAYTFPAHAFESTSTDFFIRGDIGYAAGDVTSTDFQLFSNGQLNAMSTITSTDFEIIPGVIRTIFQPVKPIYTQIHYHWRNDNGSETSATSATGGIEDTPLTGLAQNTSIRVRMEITNDGGTIFSYSAQSFQLQYGLLSSTCSAISSWTAVGTAAAVWGMYNSTNLTDGVNTTDIATSTGGVADGNHSFIVANAGVKTTTSTVALISVPSDSFIETEFDIEALSSSTAGATYCFRLTNAGSATNFAYAQYPEAALSVPPINPVTNASGTVGTSQVLLSWTNPTSTYFAGTLVLRATSTPPIIGIATTTYSIGAGTEPFGVAFDGTNMWVTNVLSGNVTKVTPTGATTTYSIGPGTEPTYIAFDGTNMWIVDNGTNSVTKMTPTGATTTYSLGSSGLNLTGIAFDGTNMWVVEDQANNVVKMTPTGATTTYGLGAATSPYGIAFDGTNMWVTDNNTNNVVKMTPTGATTTYSIGAGTQPAGIAFDGTNMWVLDSGTSTVTKVTPTGATTTYSIGAGTQPAGIAFDGTNMWVTNFSSTSTVLMVTPTGATTTYVMGNGLELRQIAFDGTNMWMAAQGGNSVIKIALLYQPTIPVNGTTYTVGQAIGSSTVACVVASSTSGCTDTGLTNGTKYFYEIFAYDAFANYSTYVTPTGSPFTPGSTQTIALTLNSSTVNLPNLAPGVAVSATTTATVSVTGATSGYTLFINRNSATSTIASGTIAFPDYTSWGPSGSTCASGQGNGTTTPGNTLSFRVASSGTTANYCSFWWGASDVGGTAIYAGVPTTTQIIVNSTSSASQNGTTAVTIIYSANAPTSQKATSYTGGVTITAIANP